MDITVTRSRKTFYQLDGAVAAILLEAFPDLFERVERPQPAPRPTEPTWGIGQTDTGYVRIILQLPSGETRTFDGRPDEATTGFKYVQWDAAQQARILAGPVPPKEIIAKYESLWKPRPVAQQ